MSAGEESETTSDTRKYLPNLRRIGLAQRLVLWGVLAGIISMSGAGLLQEMSPGGVAPFLALLSLLLLLGVTAFQLFGVYRLTKAFGMSTILVVPCLVAMFIPIISLLCLLTLSTMATSTLKQAGIRVGLMGARVTDLPPE